MGARARNVGMIVVLALLATACNRVSWLQFGGDSAHRGSIAASTITLANAATLHPVWQATLPAPQTIDSSPVYLTDVSTPAGKKDVVYVTTLQGDVFAFDAGTGTQLWTRSFPRDGCVTINGQNCSTPSSPAIDPRRTHVYVYGLDGYLHKLAVGDGTETIGDGWPQLITSKRSYEKGSSSVSTATSGGVHYAYLPTSAYVGVTSVAQGHLVAVNLLDGSQRVFNTLCSDQTVHFVEPPGSPNCAAAQSGVWARAGTMYDPKTDRLLIATGNGPYDPANHHWADSVLALHPDGTGGPGGDPLDSYTPAHFQTLQDNDQDLGSTLPALIQDLPGSAYDDLGVMSGKDAKIRLLNLRDLSGQGGPGHLGGEIGPVIDVPQGGVVSSQPAVWTNPDDGSRWVFVTNFAGTSAFEVVVDGAGLPSLALRWRNFTIRGSSPLIAGRLLYVIGAGRFGAYNAVTGASVYLDTAIGGAHFQEPIVVNGRLYLPDNFGHLTAYAVDP